jgi:uncharacterized protein (DUF1501 family)
MDSMLLSRRSLLAAGVGLLAAPRAAAAALSKRIDNFATLINLGGGNDALNTLIPTRLSTYARVRPRIALRPEQALSLDAGPYRTLDYAVHPALPTLARLYHEGQAAFVRLAGYPGTNQSHTTSEDTWSRGTLREPPDSGWIARYKDLYARPPRGVVALGLEGRLDFRGAQTPVTFTLRSERDGQLYNGDSTYPANDRLRHTLVEAVATSSGTQPKFELPARALLAAYEQERVLSGGGRSAPIRPTYPTSDIGLVLERAGSLHYLDDFETRIFYARTFGAQFDTHYNQGTVEGEHADALRAVDEALGVYIRELRDLGQWQSAVIVLFSEFGRRTASTFDGSDHGEGGLVIVLGGAIHGGMYGPDLREEMLERSSLPVEVDFRSVYAEMLAGHLGANPALVFPEAYGHTPLGLFG